jgi:hypothetical protein
MGAEMTDEEIRVAALTAAISWFRECCGDIDFWLPRQVVIDTASRFEEYIKTGH